MKLKLTKLMCAYKECNKKFSPIRKWQRYHTSKCRKDDWNAKFKKVLETLEKNRNETSAITEHVLGTSTKAVVKKKEVST